MGIIHPGAPFDAILELVKVSGIDAFVETGTYRGTTSRWAAQHFASVFTIERAEPLYQEFSGGLRSLGNVEPLLGDSKDQLPHIVSQLKGRPAIFWLDGHWSGGETAGEGDECPILEELAALRGRKGDIVLIDDARLFLAAPLAPHRADQWPTIAEIVLAVAAWPEPPFVQVIEDVIYFVPPTAPLKQRLIDYGRERAAIVKKAGKKKRTLAEKFKKRIGKLIGRR